jgi:transaldolase/glucose-6-phosphate isomerase
VANASEQRTTDLPPALDGEVEATLAEWRAGDRVRRLWQRDASLWTGKDEAKWLGWLDLDDPATVRREELPRFAAEVRDAGFTHALLLGMGGSSLFPEVLAVTLGARSGFPQLHVLDSTDPAQVSAFERKIDLPRTLFIVASKSGSTLEPNIFQQYFFDRARQALGAGEAGRRFIAITDPGSKLEQVARDLGFRRIFAGKPSIGGRFSALSHFGMAPAAILGLDTDAFLDRAGEMARACGPDVPPEANPGVRLGTVLGTAARHGRDKVTIVASPALWDFGAWLEQLLAESTGKEGTGLVPVDREPLGPPSVYGDDRVFVYMRLAGAPDAAQDQSLAALAAAGQPVVRIEVAEPEALSAEVFRWEFATAVAGSVLGINPFDQPDVEASKVKTRALTEEYERAGPLPHETPVFSEGDIRLFTDAKNAEALRQALGGERSLPAYLRAHLRRAGAGDYVALLAYIEMSEAHRAPLQAMRAALRDRLRVATCLGFGPRFLHSTGQAYKGGPNSGVFLQITCDDAADLPVPGQSYTFGVVKAAQARGDFAVLVERGRRALRVHLGPDLLAGLEALRRAVESAQV